MDETSSSTVQVVTKDGQSVTLARSEYHVLRPICTAPNEKGVATTPAKKHHLTFIRRFHRITKKDDYSIQDSKPLEQYPDIKYLFERYFKAQGNNQTLDPINNIIRLGFQGIKRDRNSKLFKNLTWCGTEFVGTLLGIKDLESLYEEHKRGQYKTLPLDPTPDEAQRIPAADGSSSSSSQSSQSLPASVSSWTGGHCSCCECDKDDCSCFGCFCTHHANHRIRFQYLNKELKRLDAILERDFRKDIDAGMQRYNEWEALQEAQNRVQAEIEQYVIPGRSHSGPREESLSEIERPIEKKRKLSDEFDEESKAFETQDEIPETGGKSEAESSPKQNAVNQEKEERSPPSQTVGDVTPTSSMPIGPPIRSPPSPNPSESTGMDLEEKVEEPSQSEEIPEFREEEEEEETDEEVEEQETEELEERRRSSSIWDALRRLTSFNGRMPMARLGRNRK